MNRVNTLLLIVLSFAIIHITSYAQEESHLLITVYPGSVLRGKADIAQFDEYELITGIPGNKEFDSIVLEGKVSKYKYKNPEDRSKLEIMKNYEDALLAAGAEEIFSCAGKECGNYPGYVWRNYNGLDPRTVDRRYKAFKLNTDDITAYVAIMVNEQFHFVHVIEVKEMESGLVDVDITKLTKSIDTKGSVSIYGIYFDTGKADLKPESKPALDQIAELMKVRPDLSIYVVGHTDSDGTLDLNMNLSKARANLVVEELVSVYSIEPSRVKPYGVGPLSPVESNDTDQGKSKNRRVELVKQ